MILLWLIIIPLAGGALAWYAGRIRPSWPRWVSLITALLMFWVSVNIWIRHYASLKEMDLHGPWLLEVRLSWIPQLGAGFHLAADGLSLLLVLLTAFLGLAAVASSWTEIRERVGFFHLNLLWILAGIIGVFLAIDLFLFYFFWELMLVPMYFLIALWGHENRRYAAFKFFIFTQAGGLLMLISILGLYFVHGKATGTYSFDYPVLLGTPMGIGTEFWLMLGFFIAFAVKLPVVPLHNWLPDAHTEAPTAGSVVLAGLLLKTGAYGLIRFVVPLFPHAAGEFAPAAMILAVIGIIYGAIMAFGQSDLKRLVAYTSVSHMGFVLLGVFVWSEVALQGAVMQIVCHGLATGALFIIVGALQERIHTREMGRMGGLWETAPRMGVAALFFALASLGLPGLGNFVGEFLVLLGAYRASIPITVIAAAGIVGATVYSLLIVQRAFHGPNEQKWKIPDLSFREMAVTLVMMLSLIWLGLYPQPVLNSSRQAISNLRMSASAGTKAEGARVGQEEDKRLNADVSQRTGGPAEKSHKSGGV
jgi:NADH-quinone oxidoreductase subunit M